MEDLMDLMSSVPRPFLDRQKGLGHAFDSCLIAALLHLIQ